MFFIICFIFAHFPPPYICFVLFLCIRTGDDDDNGVDFWQSISPVNSDPLPVPYDRHQKLDAVEEQPHASVKVESKNATTVAQTECTKISTGCGPSPPRDLAPTITKEMNTPQSISTQVKII